MNRFRLQVKVWFQNRRMKWRHSRETKIEKHRNAKLCTKQSTDNAALIDNESSLDSNSCSSSDEKTSEIDVVAE